LQKQFNIFYKEEDVLLQAHELFDFDHLTKWNIQDKIMFMDQAETDAYYDKEKKTGRIPLHNMGRASIDEVIDDLEPIRERLNYAKGSETRRIVPINLTITNTQITGKIDPVFGNKYISVCNSKQQLKYLIVAYTRYLAMLAQGEEFEFVFISKYLDSLQKIAVGAISQQAAIDTLTKYLDYFMKGHQKYFHFFPAIGQNEMEMISEAHDMFWDIYENSKEGELDFTFEDDYLNKAVEHGFFDEPAFEQIKDNVHAIFDPIQGLLPAVFAKIKQKK
jgi:exonuclease V gamma subunit